MALYKSINKYK